jgi:FtsH-binding integral membrane protein
VPLSLATPDRIHCPSCDHQGPPTPEVAAQLAEAQGALDECAAVDRQLGKAQRSAVQWGQYSEIGYLLMVAIFVGPFVMYGLKAGVEALFDKGVLAAVNWIMVVSVVPVVLILLVAALLGWVFLRRSRRKLERACCAVPPSRAGEPASCHVCGGLLQSKGTQKVVRCGYCGGDNLVATAVLRRAGVRRKAVVGDYQREVRQQAVQVSSTLGKATIAFLILVFVSPVLCGAPTLIVAALVMAFGMATWAIVETNKPPSDDQRYGIAVVPEGRCVCWIDPYEDEHTVAFDPPLPSETVVTMEDLEEIWSIGDLIGRQVLVRSTGDTGVVDKATAGLHIAEDGTTHEGGSRVYVQVDEGTRYSESVAGLCLVVDE